MVDLVDRLAMNWIGSLRYRTENMSGLLTAGAIAFLQFFIGQLQHISFREKEKNGRGQHTWMEFQRGEAHEDSSAALATPKVPNSSSYSHRSAPPASISSITSNSLYSWMSASTHNVDLPARIWKARVESRSMCWSTHCRREGYKN